MIQNENLIKLIKKDTRNSLNFYKNLVQESLLNSKDLVEKATDVREKLNSGQKVNKNQPQEIPNIAKQIKQEIKNQKTLQNLEKISFRKEAKSTPKIQIFNQRINKNENKRPPKLQGILSFFDSENLTFYPSSNILTTESTNVNDEASKKAEQRTKIVRNNIDYDNKIKPLFFTNRYVEYSYQDRGDNLYEDGDLFRYLFEKKMKKEKNPGLNIVKQDSIYLDTFKKLLKKIKDEKEEENIKHTSDSTGREGEEDNLASDELKKINRYKSFKNDTKSKSSSSGGGVGDGNEKNKTTDFKSFFLSKISLCENNAISATNNNSDVDWNIEKENPSLGKSTSDVSFNIDIESQMLKKINRKNKKEINRKIKINGPIVTIFKVPSDIKDLQSIQEKAKFDVRNIKIEGNEEEENNNKNNKMNDMNNNIDTEFGIKKINRNESQLNLNLSLIHDTQYKEEFLVKKIIKNGKEINRQIKFFSRKIEEFQNKTYCQFFLQIQRYYKDFLINIENATYQALKYLSNPNCTSLELCPTESQKLLEHLYWHPKIQSLTIPASFVASLKQVMESRNWECLLTTLTITQDVGVSSPPFEESLYKLFSGINSIPIQNIHFIDVPYHRTIADALFIHINLYYSINNSILNSFFSNEKQNNNYNIMSTDKDVTSSEEIDDPKTTLFLNIQKTKLPIINLSWKKNPNSKMKNTKSEESIDLRAIYYILMEMLIKAYKFNNHKLPEVFNKLDLSGTIVTDDIGFLVKIITQFKIIKELDISNTKLFSYGKVINSENFLRKIKLTNKFTKVMDVDGENTFMNNVLKEIEFFKNCTELQKSQLSDFLKDEEMCYDFFMGILPIIEKIYVYNTDIKENVARDIYMLFRKLKFFHGFYCSSSTNNNNIFINTINNLTDIIQNDSGNFCENIFLIS